MEWWWLWTTDGWSGGTGCLIRTQTVHGGDVLALNGAQLHAVSGIMALNRSQLHMGCSDDSYTLATLIEITGRGWERGRDRKRSMDRKGGGKVGGWVPFAQACPPLFICNPAFSQFKGCLWAFAAARPTWIPITLSPKLWRTGSLKNVLVLLKHYAVLFCFLLCFCFFCNYDLSSHHHLVITQNGFFKVTSCCLPTYQIIVMLTAAKNTLNPHL